MGVPAPKNNKNVKITQNDSDVNGWFSICSSPGSPRRGSMITDCGCGQIPQMSTTKRVRPEDCITAELRLNLGLLQLFEHWLWLLPVVSDTAHFSLNIILEHHDIISPSMCLPERDQPKHLLSVKRPWKFKYWILATNWFYTMFLPRSEWDNLSLVRFFHNLLLDGWSGMTASSMLILLRARTRFGSF